MNATPSFYLVAYDLHEPDKDKKYTDVEEQIYGLEDQCKILETTWIVKTKLTSGEIKKRLLDVVDRKDHVYTGRIDLHSSAGRLTPDASRWIEEQRKTI